MKFRPFPILTLACIPVLALLIYLGAWQAQRARWKSDLIARYEAASKAAPTPLARLCDAGGKLIAASGAVVSTTPEIERKPLRIFGAGADGVSGWRLFSVAKAPCGGGAVLAEIGFEPFQMGGGEAKQAKRSVPDAWIVAEYQHNGVFAARSRPEENTWYGFDPPEMAKALGEPALNMRVYLESRGHGLPSSLARVPPAQHIGYSITWFGMAIGLAAVYAVFHIRAGRLEFRRKAAAAVGKETL